jgi:PAS domain S-box-containing protein
LNSILGIEEVLDKTSFVGVIFITSTKLVADYNKEAIRMLSLGAAEYRGQPVDSIIDNSKWQVIFNQNVGNTTGKVEHQGKVLDFEYLQFKNSVDEVSAAIIINDVSVYEKEIELLRPPHGIWSNIDDIIESSYDGIYITDGEANTLRINKAYERITGLKREEILGKNMIDLVKEEYISESATLLVLQNKRINTIHQNFKTGKKALVTATPIFDKVGKIMMVVTNVRDITELYELKEELEEKERLAKKYYLEIQQIRMQLLNSEDIIAEDIKMLHVMQIAKKVAFTDTTVILLGETGVGKEEIAKLIYKNSLRRDKQFISINCGAMPESLIELEMFGYEKGSFTGASREGKLGLFEVADGGTVFLDEIAELSPVMQTKLLRVLQEHEIKRIGGVTSIKVDVRIIAATNRNLEEMVNQNKFRKDLYYRLNVIPITVPPLRERQQDIIPLIRYFLSEINNKYKLKKSLGADVLEYLCEYEWPGNVRELKNIIERVVVMSAQDIITKEDLPKQIQVLFEEKIFSSDEIVALKDAVNKVEEQLINKAYEKYGSVRAAAKALNIDPATFVRKRKKHAK